MHKEGSPSSVPGTLVGEYHPTDSQGSTVASSSTSRNQSLEHEVKALLISVEFNALGFELQRWHMFASGQEGTAIPSSHPEKNGTGY